MKLFFKALLKALFGDLGNSLAVLLGVLVVLTLVALGEAPIAGWVMVVELLFAVAWLSGRYVRPQK